MHILPKSHQKTRLFPLKSWKKRIKSTRYFNHPPLARRPLFSKPVTFVTFGPEKRPKSTVFSVFLHFLPAALIHVLSLLSTFSHFPKPGGNLLFVQKAPFLRFIPDKTASLTKSGRYSVGLIQESPGRKRPLLSKPSTAPRLRAFFLRFRKLRSALFGHLRHFRTFPLFSKSPETPTQAKGLVTFFKKWSKSDPPRIRKTRKTPIIWLFPVSGLEKS